MEALEAKGMKYCLNLDLEKEMKTSSEIKYTVVK